MMLVDLTIGFLALVMLVLPGWLWARSRRLPLPLLAGFMSGLVALVLLVQLLSILGIRFTLPVFLLAWSAALILAWYACGNRLAPAAPAAEWRGQWPLLLTIIPAGLVVAYRAIAQPLSGIDTIFRWNYLAELMLRHGTLGFYPPVTAADYALYSWADGIAPVVSSLYWWSYAFAAEARPVLTAPGVIAQFLLLLAGVWVLVRRTTSARAAAFACALVAASPLILWSTAMGQESALTALALVGLLLYLPASRDQADHAGTILAGVCVAIGALAREYGLAFLLFGLALAWARQLDRKTILLFLLTTLVCVLPWYGRNWLRTGNPLFNLDALGLFPVNRGHLALMDTYRESFGWDHLPAEASRLFLTNTIAALVGAFAGLFATFRPVRAWLAAGLLVVLLWVGSLGFTAAGFTYSMRVLTPALALAAAAGGSAFARWVPGRKNLVAVVIALLLLTTDAALRALALPANIYRLPPAAWLTAGGAVHDYHALPLFGELARVTSGHRVLVLGPNALLTRQGAATVPLWSPEVSCLWDESVSHEVAAGKLAAAGIDYVLLGKGPVNQQYLSRIPFFRGKVSTVLQLVWAGEDLILFRVIPPATLPVP